MVALNAVPRLAKLHDVHMRDAPLELSLVCIIHNARCAHAAAQRAGRVPSRELLQLIPEMAVRARVVLAALVDLAQLLTLLPVAGMAPDPRPVGPLERVVKNAACRARRDSSVRPAA